MMHVSKVRLTLHLSISSRVFDAFHASSKEAVIRIDFLYREVAPQVSGLERWLSLSNSEYPDLQRNAFPIDL